MRFVMKLCTVAVASSGRLRLLSDFKDMEVYDR
jgi:hypothetical protein